MISNLHIRIFQISNNFRYIIRQSFKNDFIIKAICLSIMINCRKFLNPRNLVKMKPILWIEQKDMPFDHDFGYSLPS